MNRLGLGAAAIVCAAAMSVAYLTAGDPSVIKLLGKESPDKLAHRLVAATKLGEPKRGGSTRRARLAVSGRRQ